MKKIFYNASLPRSGSTLLQNVLAQNPDIYATPTSGLSTLIQSAKTTFSSRPEFAALDKNIMKYVLFRELSHYLGIPYNKEGLIIMTKNNPKEYSYSWIDDYEKRQIAYDDLFKELKKYID